MKDKRSKILIWVVGSVTVLAVIVYAGWQYFKKDLARPDSKIAKPLLTDQIKKMVIDASDSLYRLQYDRFELDIDKGKGLLTGVKIIPDSNVEKRLLKAGKLPNTIIHLRIDSLRLHQFGFRKTSAGRRFNIQSVTLYHPVARIINKRRIWNEKDRTHESSALLKAARSILKVSAVSTMNVRNLLFTWVDQNGPNEKETTFEHWNIKADGSRAYERSTRNGENEHKTVSYHTDRIRIATPDSLYHIVFVGADLMPDARLMTTELVEVSPRLGRTAFYRAAKYDKDRIHLIYKHLALRNIDIDQIWQHQRFHIGKATVGSFWGEVLNDHHWPKRRPPVRGRPHPHQKLKQLAFNITIDTMLMHNGYFQYTIAARRSGENSKLFMTGIESRIYNITNDQERIRKKHYLTSYTRSKIMGAGLTSTTFKFDLGSTDGAFVMTSQMGRMTAAALNPLARPLAQISVREGVINKMLIELKADNSHAQGHLDLYYKGMKLDLLKRDKEADTLKKRGFLSFLANTFTPNDNPKKNGKFREGPINVIREPRGSFFGLLWKSTLDGMTSAMSGLEQHKDKPDESFLTRGLKSIIKPHHKEVKKN